MDGSVWSKEVKAGGRSTRLTFWVVFLLPSILIVLLAIWVDNEVVGLGDPRSPAGPTPYSIAAMFLVALPLLIIGTVRRLHDLNLTGWLVLLWIVGPVGVAMLLGETAGAWTWGLGLVALAGATCLLPGTVGPNQYGPDPRGGSDDPSDLSEDVVEQRGPEGHEEHPRDREES